MSGQLTTSRYLLGDRAFDVTSGEISNGTGTFRLSRKCALVLSYLVARAPAMVSREELARVLWPREQTGVPDDRLNHVLSRLRSALKQVGVDPVSVETCPGFGYRYVGNCVPEPAGGYIAGNSHRAAAMAGSEVFDRAVPSGVVTAIVRPLVVASVLAVTVLAIWLLPSAGPGTDRKPQLMVLRTSTDAGQGPAARIASRLMDEIAIEIARIGSVEVTSVEDGAGIGPGVHVLRFAALPSGVNEGLRAGLRMTRDDEPIWATVIEQRAEPVANFTARAVEETILAVHQLLVADELERLAAVQAMSSNVRELMVEGRRLLRAGRYDDAIDTFRRVVAADPALAYGHSELARALINYGWYAPVESMMVMPEAKLAAWRALDLDPSLADPYVVLGNIAAFFELEWTEAAEYYEKAIERNPNHVDAYLDFAAHQLVTGDIARGVELIHKAERAGRNSADVQGQIGILYHLIDEWELALRHYDIALSLDPGNFFWRVNKACTYIFAGELDRAGELIESIRRDKPEESFPKIIEAFYRATIHDQTRAHNALMTIDPATLPPMSRLMRSSIFVALGRHEDAIEQLEVALEARLLALPYTAIHPAHDPVRDHPRYVALLDRIGLSR